MNMNEKALGELKELLEKETVISFEIENKYYDDIDNNTGRVLKCTHTGYSIFLKTKPTSLRKKVNMVN